jgi:glycosyltransferase involved in cell wall biosynthesis
MKVAHFAMWGCRQSGLYECAKDQIKYERKHGIDAILACSDDENPNPKLIDDGWLSPVSWEEARGSDLYVIHRGLPSKLDDKANPKKNIFVVHGTAEFLMLEEVASHAETTPFNTHINLIRDCDLSVAVNQHDFDIYKIYDNKNRLSLIHDAIDVERFTIEGYQHPYLMSPRILFCDSLRPNKHPAHAIWAMTEVIKKIPTARLSIVGLTLNSVLTWRNLILRSPNQHLLNCMECIQLMTSELRPYMRGADILVNGNMSGIASRVELEAMSCGCSVVSYSGEFSKWHPKPFDIKDIACKIVECWEEISKDPEGSRRAARDWVIQNANMERQVVEKYIPLYESLVGAKK